MIFIFKKMDPNSNTSKDKNKDIKTDKSNSILQKIKSDYFLEKICDNILRNKSLGIVRYNKNLQNRLNLCIKDYEILAIEVEIIPCKKKYGILLILKKMINYIIIYFLMIIKKK